MQKHSTPLLPKVGNGAGTRTCTHRHRRSLRHWVPCRFKLLKDSILITDPVVVEDVLGRRGAEELPKPPLIYAPLDPVGPAAGVQAGCPVACAGAHAPGVAEAAQQQAARSPARAARRRAPGCAFPPPPGLPRPTDLQPQEHPQLLHHPRP